MQIRYLCCCWLGVNSFHCKLSSVENIMLLCSLLEVYDRVNFQSDAEKMYNTMKENSVEMHCQKLRGGCFCAGSTNSFTILPSVNDSVKEKKLYGNMDLVASEKVRDLLYLKKKKPFQNEPLFGFLIIHGIVT